MSTIAEWTQFHDQLTKADGYREIPLPDRKKCFEFETKLLQFRKTKDPDEVAALEAAYASATNEARNLVEHGRLILEEHVGEWKPLSSVPEAEEIVVADEVALGCRIDPAAELIPPMRKCEFDALLSDIQVNGQRESIVLREGKVLDGRHRLLACLIAGVEPRFVEWDGAGSPEGYVLSANVLRRHLSDQKRALLAAEAAEAFAVGAKQRSLQNLQQNRQNPERLDPTPRKGGKSIDRAAKTFNVAPNAAKAAAKVRRKGVPELVQAVAAGSVALDAAAQLADLPEDEQLEIINKGEGKKAAKEIRDAKAARRARTDTNAIVEGDGSADSAAAGATATPRPRKEDGLGPAGGVSKVGEQTGNGGPGRPVLGAEASQLPKRTLRVVDELAKELGSQAREVLLNPRYFATSTIEKYAELDLEAQCALIDFVASGNARPIVELLLVRKPAEVSPLVAGTCPTDAWGTFISKVNAIHAQFDALDGMVGNKVLNDEQVILALDGLSVKVRAIKATRGKRAPHPESEASKAKRR